MNARDPESAASVRRVALSVAAAATCALGGCAQLQPDPGHQQEAVEQVSRIDRHSSFPVVRRTYLEQVNLVEMIDPDGLAITKARWPKELKNQPESSGDKAAATDPHDWGIRYDMVLAWFRSTSDLSATEKAIRRDGVQDKIMAATESRCNVFKTFLRRQQSDVNFQLGTATTVAGVLGAVLPGATDSRNLAAVAGILSGAQAEFNSAYYSNLAAQVIAQGVEVRMARLKKEVLQGRNGKSITDYSMEAAIKDAITIDGACSTIAGLTEASESIKESVNPGLARAAEVIAAVKVAGEVARATNVKDMVSSGELARLLKQASVTLSPLTVAYVGDTGVDQDNALQAALIAASRAHLNLQNEVGVTAVETAAQFQLAQKPLAEGIRSALTQDKVAIQFASDTGGVGKSISALPFKACQEKIPAALSALTQATAAAKLEEPDKVKRMKLDTDLSQARGGAKAVLQNIDLLTTTARSVSMLTASAWQKKFATPKLTEATLTAAVVPPPDLSALCK